MAAARDLSFVGDMPRGLCGLPPDMTYEVTVGINQKLCRGCGVVKRVSLFGRIGSGGRAARCLACKNAAARARHEKLGGHSEARKQYGWAWHLRSRYGITPEYYAALLTEQGGVCAVCAAPNSDGGRRLAVDHDHATGRVRGLLCRACNRAIGGLKDNPELLRKALRYLEHSE